MKSDVGLYGLVLAGGQSRRMQADKALLVYHGKSQLQWTYDLLQDYCVGTYISVRRDQHDPVRDALPRIEDAADNLGPAAGLLAAAQHADSAWLVVACDLPFLSPAVLQRLCDSRDPAMMATAYRSAHDSLPEPLCAIWEPAGLAWLAEQVGDGRPCPRKALILGNVNLIAPVTSSALDNINTPDDLAVARASLGAR